MRAACCAQDEHPETAMCHSQTLTASSCTQTTLQFLLSHSVLLIAFKNMSTERVYTLTSSQLAATAEMISCLNAGLPLPDLIKEAVPRDVQGILTQQFSLLRTVSAADIGKEAKGGKQAKEGKEKKRKQDTEKVMRGMTSYNLFAQRVQTIADLHKEHPIIQQVNPDGTKKMMAWIGEVWALTSDAHKV